MRGGTTASSYHTHLHLQTGTGYDQKWIKMQHLKQTNQYVFSFNFDLLWLIAAAFFGRKIDIITKLKASLN